MELTFLEILPILKNFSLGLVYVLLPIFLSLILIRKFTLIIKESSQEVPTDHSV